MVTREAGGSAQGRRLTARGAATRDRIVQAAADLMYVRGVNATTLDDVIAASSTSKSQLYRHFPSKEDLVHAVIALRGQQVMARENQRLERLSSFRGLIRWRDALVQANSLQNGAYGCALGSMANELADQDEQAVVSLAELFARLGALFLRQAMLNAHLKNKAAEVVRQKNALTYLADVHTRLTNAVLDGASIGTVVTLLAELSAKPVVLYDETFRVLAWDELDGPLARTESGASLAVARLEIAKRQLPVAGDSAHVFGVTWAAR